MPVAKARQRPPTIAPGLARRRGDGLRAGAAFSVLALLVALALTVPSGSVGGIVHGWLGYGFGWASYLVPVVIDAFAVASIRSGLAASYRMTRLEGAGWVIVFVDLVAALPGADDDPLPRWDAFRGGGWVGRHVWD